MNNLTFKDPNGAMYRRITKRNARNAFKQGKPVIICPSNLKPFSPWHSEIEIKLNDYLKNYPDETPEIIFNSVVNRFEFYNCTDIQTGYKANYYIMQN